MTRIVLAAGLAIVLTLVGGAARAADGADALARARRLYNQRDYANAMVAAAEARRVPALAERAALVWARAAFEQLRVAPDPALLAEASPAIARIDPARLPPAEQIEWTTGLGEGLFLDGRYGAAAELFADALAGQKPGAARERLLDWWASARDRQAQALHADQRPSIYVMVAERMQQELATTPGSTAATYWTVVAERGIGRPDAAWDAALAGWLRARLTSDRGAALRADLDRFVFQAVIPERVRMQGLPESAVAGAEEALRAEWQRFKERWASS